MEILECSICTHVNVHDRNVDVVQELRVEFNRLARRKKYHDLLGAILLEEGEKEEESRLRRTNHISLMGIETR